MNGPTTGDVYDGPFPLRDVMVVEVKLFGRGWSDWWRTHTTWEGEFKDYANGSNMLGPWRLKPPAEQTP